MNQWLDGTRSLALRVASDAGSGLRSGWQGAAKAASRIVDTDALRNGSRQVARTVQRNPGKTATTLVAFVGAGLALWALRRKYAASEHVPEEIKPVRMGNAKVRRARVARKATP